MKIETEDRQKIEEIIFDTMMAKIGEPFYGDEFEGDKDGHESFRETAIAAAAKIAEEINKIF